MKRNKPFSETHPTNTTAVFLGVASEIDPQHKIISESLSRSRSSNGMIYVACAFMNVAGPLNMNNEDTIHIAHVPQGQVSSLVPENRYAGSARLVLSPTHRDQFTAFIIGS